MPNIDTDSGKKDSSANSIGKKTISSLLLLFIIIISPILEYLMLWPSFRFTAFMFGYFLIVIPGYLFWNYIGNLFSGNFKYISRIMKFFPKNSYGLVKSFYSSPSTIRQKIYVSGIRSLSPTAFGFFLISSISALMPNGRISSNLIGIAFILIIPVISGVIVPLRIIMDSSLIKYSLEKRIIEPFGVIVYRLLRSVLGIGVIISYLVASMKTDNYIMSALDFIAILFYLFPTIFVVNITYIPYITKHIEKLDRLLLESGLPEYKLVMKRINVEKDREDDSDSLIVSDESNDDSKDDSSEKENNISDGDEKYHDDFSESYESDKSIEDNN